MTPELNDLIFNLIVAVAGVLLSALKGSELYASMQGTKRQRALDVLMSSVERTYQVYVKEIKGQGRKLTDEERENARRKAVRDGIEMAAKQGLDLVKEFGEEALPALVSRLSQQAKQKQ